MGVIPAQADLAGRGVFLHKLLFGANPISLGEADVGAGTIKGRNRNQVGQRKAVFRLTIRTSLFVPVSYNDTPDFLAMFVALRAIISQTAANPAGNGGIHIRPGPQLITNLRHYVSAHSPNLRGDGLRLARITGQANLRSGSNRSTFLRSRPRSALLHAMLRVPLDELNTSRRFG